MEGPHPVNVGSMMKSSSSPRKRKIGSDDDTPTIVKLNACDIAPLVEEPSRGEDIPSSHNRPTTLRETKKDDSVPERAKSGVKKQGTRSPTKNRTATWYEYVQSLAAFKANHGHLKVPHDFIDPDNDLELGLWVKYLQKEYIAKQKNPRYRSQFLTHRRQAVLDSMGFEWEIIRMPGSPTTPTSKDFKSGTGMKDPSSWGHDYIYNMNQDCSSFCDWAEKEIALLEPMIQSPNSDESSAFLTYPEFEATFRVCLLKLSTERYPQRLKKIKMES